MEKRRRKRRANQRTDLDEFLAASSDSDDNGFGLPDRLFAEQEAVERHIQEIEAGPFASAFTERFKEVESERLRDEAALSKEVARVRVKLTSKEERKQAQRRLKPFEHRQRCINFRRKLAIRLEALGEERGDMSGSNEVDTTWRTLHDIWNLGRDAATNKQDLLDVCLAYPEVGDFLGIDREAADLSDALDRRFEGVDYDCNQVLAWDELQAWLDNQRVGRDYIGKRASQLEDRWRTLYDVWHLNRDASMNKQDLLQVCLAYPEVRNLLGLNHEEVDLSIALDRRFKDIDYDCNEVLTWDEVQAWLDNETSKSEYTESRHALARRMSAETVHLEHLVELGHDDTRCGECDAAKMSLEAALVALRRVSEALVKQVEGGVSPANVEITPLGKGAHQMSSRRMLGQVAAELDRTAHVDPRFKQLASVIPRDI